MENEEGMHSNVTVGSTSVLYKDSLRHLLLMGVLPDIVVVDEVLLKLIREKQQKTVFKKTTRKLQQQTIEVKLLKKISKFN